MCKIHTSCEKKVKRKKKLEIYHLRLISTELKLSDPRFLYGPGDNPPSSSNTRFSLLQFLNPTYTIATIKTKAITASKDIPTVNPTRLFFFPTLSRTLK